MVSNHPALRRLREHLRSPADRALLDGAEVVQAGAGALHLRVRGRFQKERLEARHAAALREAFRGPVLVVVPPRAIAAPRPAPEFALRMVRAFVEGGPAASPLVVIHGPAHAGKSTLLRLARAMGTNDVFEVDVERLGRSRGFVPRKPLVVVDRAEALAGKVVAQRALCHMLDAVRTRGGRVLLALDGHPAHREGIERMLRNRLLGGVLVPLDGRAAPPPPTGPLGAMKDVAARLFEVDRGLLDGATKRRSVVEARRAVIAAARRGGLAEPEIAAAFGLRSVRAVRDACRWVERHEASDTRLAAFIHEVGRVLPKS